jgi:hypothetical protein
MSQDEQGFYEKLREYLEDGFALAKRQGSKGRESLRDCFQLLARAQGALTCQDRYSLSGIQNIRSSAQVFHRREPRALCAHVGGVMRKVALGGLLPRQFLVL